MTRPSLRLVYSGKPRTPSNAELHAFVKDRDQDSAEERAERNKEKRDQLATIFVIAFAIKLFCWILGDL